MHVRSERCHLEPPPQRTHHPQTAPAKFDREFALALKVCASRNCTISGPDGCRDLEAHTGCSNSKSNSRSMIGLIHASQRIFHSELLHVSRGRLPKIGHSVIFASPLSAVRNFRHMRAESALLQIRNNLDCEAPRDGIVIGTCPLNPWGVQSVGESAGPP